MHKKPSYEKLQQKVNALEKQIIEVKESEAALRDSEQDYRDLYENAPIAYFSINRNDGYILRSNSEAVRLLGYEVETLAQMNVFDKNCMIINTWLDPTRDRETKGRPASYRLQSATK